MKRELLIQRHYEEFWGAEMSTCAFSRGPVHQLPVDFRVLSLPPSQARFMWTYATVGMSSVSDDVPIELHIFSPSESVDIVEMLYATAHYHRTGNRLGLGHTVNFGRAWLDGSSCDHGLVSLPYLDGPSLENFSACGWSAKCYWLVPVTASEVAYKAKMGLAALEAKFEECNFNYVDPGRPSVV